MPWHNGRLHLFHGTNSHALSAVPRLHASAPFAIDFAKCRPKTDFGQGFCATTSLHQASEWANCSVNYLANRRKIVGSCAIVLRFEAVRDELATLELLAFVRDSADFYEFVAYCRSGGVPHARSGPRGRHDVVYGPVTVGMQRQMIKTRIK